MSNPRDADYGGLLEPGPPEPGTVFRAWPSGTRSVAQLLVHSDDERAPATFFVRATDGTFWSLVSRDPVLDGIAYVGMPVPNV